MANTKRPPKPVLPEQCARDDLGELSEELDAAGVRREPLSDIEGLRPELLVSGRPLRQAPNRGREDDGLDLAALAQAASAGPESQRPHELAPSPALRTDSSELYVVPGSRRPWGSMLLIGLGMGLGFAGTLFAISGNLGAPAPSTAPAPPPPATPASATAVPVAAPAPVAPAAMPVPAEPSLVAEPAAAPVAPEPALAPAAAPVALVASAAVPAPAAPAHGAGLRPPPRAPSSMSASPSHPVAVALALAPPSSAPSDPVLVVRPASERAAAAPAPAPSLASQPVTLAPAKKPGALDALLDNALSPEALRAETSRGAQPKAAPAPAPARRETPTRDEVTEIMEALLPRLSGCAMGQTGVAHASLTVRNDGSVATAQITSAPFAGTASGRCMEGVLRRAAFSHFRKPLFSVRYPFEIE